MEVFCGIDWAETHHDVAVVDESGRRLAKQRISDDLAGFTTLAALLADVTAEASGDGGFVPVDVALETDRGLMVAALRAAGHRVFAVNPKAVDRYRDRYGTSGAKSDPGDALVLANVLRTDRHAHRPLPEDSDDAAAIGVLARAHHDAVRRRVAEVNRLRNLLREFFPAALAAFPDLATRTALALLAAAPTPAAAARLSRAPRRADQGRRSRHAARRGRAAAALVATLTACDQAVRDLEKTLERAVGEHRDAPILDTLPAFGTVLAGRLLAEFGGDTARFPDAAARRAYAGTSPVTRASGKSRAVVMRRGGNRRLVDTCRTWAFATLIRSPGARAYYDRRRAAGDGHEAALRNLANKLIGQLDHCLRHRVPWDETTAWSFAVDAAAA
jgi:transposase